MKLHFEEKEIKAILSVSKMACDIAGDEMPSGMELIKTVMNNNNKLCNIKPNFFTGDVDVEISSEYIVEAMNLYVIYGPIIFNIINDLLEVKEHITRDLDVLISKYSKPLDKADKEV